MIFGNTFVKYVGIMSSNKKTIRKNFREGVFKRDNNRCKKCNSKGILDAHHITDRNEMPNGGYVLLNGISLCEKCHMKAERWHITKKVHHIVGFHPNDLYKLIGSSYEQAYEASTKLGI